MLQKQEHPPNDWRGKLRMSAEVVKILSKKGLSSLGFDIPRGNLMAQQAIMQNRVEEEMHSMSVVAKADDIELQEIMENAVRSTEDLIMQFDDPPLEHPLCKLFGLDKELRSIRDLLKVKTAKRFSWKNT